ncbi:MAG: hypothetical protein R6V44_00345 [Paracoccaceae bacterium]
MRLDRRWDVLAQRLLRLLETERRLIRRGDLAGLASQAAEVEMTLDALTASPPPDTTAAVSRWETIRSSADRNRRLLGAMSAAAQAVQASLASQDDARRRLGYDRHGAALQRSEGRRDRRA